MNYKTSNSTLFNLKTTNSERDISQAKFGPINPSLFRSKRWIRVSELACENGRPEKELNPSFIPKWIEQRRWIWEQYDINEKYDWVIISEYESRMSPTFAHVDEFEEEFFGDNNIPSWSVWYIQRREVNIDPGSYAFWCRLAGLILDRQNEKFYRKEE